MTKIEKPTTPTTMKELTEGIQEFLEEAARLAGPDDIATDEGYSQCVEAMWRSAYMAHEFVARQLGVTGFQHSMSGLRLIGVLRNMEGPFMLVDAAQALYPQSDPLMKVESWLTSDDTLEWLRDEALKMLADRDPARVHPRVLAHWQLLAQYEAPEKVQR